MLAYSPGAVVASFSFMSGRLHTWAVVFVHWQSSLCVGSHVCVGALVLYMRGCLCMGAGGCGCGRGRGCVVVVEGCGGGSGHGLWSLPHHCGRIVHAVDVVVVVVRGCVAILVH